MEIYSSEKVAMNIDDRRSLGLGAMESEGTITTTNATFPSSSSLSSPPVWLDPLLLGSAPMPIPSPSTHLSTKSRGSTAEHEQGQQVAKPVHQAQPVKTWPAPARKPAAPSDRSPREHRETLPYKRAKPARRFSDGEIEALLDLVGQYGRKWVLISRELVAKGYDQRSSTSLSQRYDGLQKAKVGKETVAPAGEAALSVKTEELKAPMAFTAKEDAMLLHLAAQVEQAGSAGSTATISWTTALPFFPGRTTQALSGRLHALKKKQKRSKQRDESERLTKEALAAFKADLGEGATSSPSQTQPDAPTSTGLIASAPGAIASSSSALPPFLASITSVSPSTSRVSASSQSRSITSIAPTPVVPVPAASVSSLKVKEGALAASSTGTSTESCPAASSRPSAVHSSPAATLSQLESNQASGPSVDSAVPCSHQLPAAAASSNLPNPAKGVSAGIHSASVSSNGRNPSHTVADPAASAIPPSLSHIVAVLDPTDLPPPNTPLWPIHVSDPPRFPPQPFRPYPFRWSIGTMKADFRRIRRKIDETGSWGKGQQEENDDEE
ncbi:hypothetical protein JCM11251_007973 [Rhodosporidiobolus azoricus]